MMVVRRTNRPRLRFFAWCRFMAARPDIICHDLIEGGRCRKGRTGKLCCPGDKSDCGYFRRSSSAPSPAFPGCASRKFYRIRRAWPAADPCLRRSSLLRKSRNDAALAPRLNRRERDDVPIPHKVRVLVAGQAARTLDEHRRRAAARIHGRRSDHQPYGSSSTTSRPPGQSVPVIHFSRVFRRFFRSAARPHTSFPHAQSEKK